MNNPHIGDQYVFVAIDSDTKLIPAFRLGKRTVDNTEKFIRDLSQRFITRFQLSTDGFTPYLLAVENSFGSDIDYGQVVKSYSDEQKGEKRYSPAKFIKVTKTQVQGSPILKDICTSHVERQNLTMRMLILRNGSS